MKTYTIAILLILALSNIYGQHVEKHDDWYIIVDASPAYSFQLRPILGATADVGVDINGHRILVNGLFFELMKKVLII